MPSSRRSSSHQGPDPADPPRRLLPSARHLLPTALATAACAVVATGSTQASVNSRWYRELDKPSFQPPGGAFPVAWTLLYADIAVTSAKTLDQLPAKQRRRFLAALAANLGLNAAWCWTFFGKREVALSVPVAAALAVSSADLARRATRAKKRYGLALAPYAAWTAFATALSDAIASRNTD